MISQKTFIQFLHGDEDATTEVYEEYRNLAYFVIATYVSNQDDCNDILSNTFLKLLRNKESVKEAKNLKQFICTIAKNEAINFTYEEEMGSNISLFAIIYDGNNHLGTRHGLFVKVFPHIITNEQQLSIRMVDNIVDVFCLEIMKDGNTNGTVCQRSEKRHAPIRTVTSAKSDLITLFDSN